MTYLFDDKFLSMLKKEDPHNVILQMGYDSRHAAQLKTEM